MPALLNRKYFALTSLKFALMANLAAGEATCLRLSALHYRDSYKIDDELPRLHYNRI
jgi:hypothetical protein